MDALMMSVNAKAAAETAAETLDVIYRDEYLIAVHKPSGLLVHRSEIDRHETRFALQIVRDQIGQYVYPVHRLDKPTSGILLMALQKETAQHLTQQFAEQRIHKQYQALVRGFVPAQGYIDHALGRVEDDYDDATTEEKQSAQTRYERVQCFEIPALIERYPVSRFSLVNVFPETGRQHQIRRHFKHIFHPLIGDVRYGRGAYNRYFREHFDCHRLMLACTAMSLQHPVSGEVLRLDCPPAAMFADTLSAMQAFVCTPPETGVPV